MSIDPTGRISSSSLTVSLPRRVTVFHDLGRALFAEWLFVA
jgi:hypothetical protein